MRLNLLGSIAFGVSSVGVYVSPETGTLVSMFWASLGTFLGAICSARPASLLPEQKLCANISQDIA